MAIPYAGEGRPQDPSSFVNLRTEAGWKLRNRLDVTHFGFWNADFGLQNAERRSGFNPKSQIPNRKIACAHSGRTTFALARTMSGWSMSCGH